MHGAHLTITDQTGLFLSRLASRRHSHGRSWLGASTKGPEFPVQNYKGRFIEFCASYSQWGCADHLLTVSARCLQTFPELIPHWYTSMQSLPRWKSRQDPAVEPSPLPLRQPALIHHSLIALPQPLNASQILY